MERCRKSVFVIFCVHCSAPISFARFVVQIMQFFVSRFVPFVLEWWKLEIGDFLPLARWFIQYTQFFVPRSVFRCLRLLYRAPEVLCIVTGSNNAEYLADIAPKKEGLSAEGYYGHLAHCLWFDYPGVVGKEGVCGEKKSRIVVLARG